MKEKELKPCLLVFAGPNGSGKSTIKSMFEIKGKYTNADDVAQPVYAVCYNQTDKAYYISGILDSNGVANLNDFILRDATNVTIFVLE